MPLTDTPHHDLDQDRVLYLVAYAHLDTQWRWDYRTTITRYLKDTLEENFRLFEAYPSYVFNFSGAIRYQMMQEYYPEEFERLKAYVQAGRWQIAGSQVEEADAIVPSPESMIRQVLYGSRYFGAEFGKDPADYILPDCFGFPWFMPTVLTHCGIVGFSTQKLTWRSAAGIPFSIGVWEGPDGSRLACALHPGNYMSRVRVRPDRNRGWIRRLTENGRRYGVWADYRYYGTGDVGGAPAERSIRTTAKSLNASGEGAITVHQGASDQFFRDLTEEQKRRLPSHSGDLLLTRHSAGSLTSQAMMKRWNRKNELLADAAERLSVIAGQLGLAYPRSVLNKAWLRVLGSQMHDILPGTSLPVCYDYTHNDETVAANTFAGVLVDGAAALAACMDTTCPEDGVSLLVYNPLAFARQDVVEATVPIQSAPAVQVIGPQGQMVPSQVVSQTEDHVRILFLADLPPCGAAAFQVTPADALPTYDTGLRVDRGGVENHRYRVALNEDGQIISIVDKADGDRELLSSPIEHQFLRETPRIFPAWNMEWKDRKRDPVAILGRPAQIEIVEAGPVRVSLQVTRTFGESRFQQQIRLACGQAGERIEFADTIDWRESGYSFKSAFPLTVSAPEATYNWRVGKIRRGNNDPAKFEVPAHQWFDLTDESESYGVTVLEDCKYGSDKPADHVLRLTLLFTPHIGPLEIMFRDQGSQDWGRHHVLYGLYGHRGGWQSGGSERQALRLNQPPRVFLVPGTDGPLGRQVSFLQIDSEQVGLLALKRAEDRDTVILRACELWGQPTGQVSISLDPRLAGPLAAAWETDGRERPIRELALAEDKLTFAMAPFEVKTFEIDLQPSTVQAPAPTWAPLDLPFNVRAFTGDGERKRGGLPGGRSYPRELIPPQIACCGVPLVLQVQGKESAVACQGQTIALPAEGGYDTLLLLAAADEDAEVTLSLDQTAVPLCVQAGEGFIGLWDRRTWDRPMDKQPDFIWRAKVTGLQPGYVKRDRVGWYTTHMHSTEANEPYAYGYMFLYAVPVPPGARQLRLPVRPDVRVFAATLTQARSNAQPAAPLYSRKERPQR
jgi:alpha-mannosidase